jgi:Fe-S cluster assembly ATP-binding protein
MLKINDLGVQANGKAILKNLNLSIDANQTFALFGPNGTHKSTIMKTIMGIPPYKVTGGSIRFMGRDISGLSINERVGLGIAVAFQQPPEIKGVTLRDMINICTGSEPGALLDSETKELVEKFRLGDFLDRNINVDFSGGEKKRADLLQILLMKPRFLMMDEPDSGVDIVSLKMICSEISAYIRREKASALIITHQGDVLEHIKATKACILWEGSNYCYRSPQKILKDIHEHGYEGCVTCRVH